MGSLIIIGLAAALAYSGDNTLFEHSTVPPTQQETIQIRIDPVEDAQDATTQHEAVTTDENTVNNSQDNPVVKTHDRMRQAFDTWLAESAGTRTKRLQEHQSLRERHKVLFASPRL